MYALLHRELLKREAEGNPVQVAIIGSGYIGRGAIIQSSFMKGIRVAAVVNRTMEKAREALKGCGAGVVGRDCVTGQDVDRCIAAGEVALLSDYRPLLESRVEMLIDTTGDPEYGACVAYDTIESGRHMLSPPETDIAVGPALKRLAHKQGVQYGGQDGDEPAVILKLYHHVSVLGFDITCIGKFKGFTDFHATPVSVKPWADKAQQNAYKISSFADGTKMNMEMGIVANASGYLPEVRGMHSPTGTLETVTDILRPVSEGGILSGSRAVESVRGVQPSGGIFVIAHSEHPRVQEDMTYYKMGNGPYYMFYTPYHMPSIELLTGAAETILFGTPAIEPMADAPFVDMATFAKRRLEPGQVMDMIGGFDYYGLVDRIENLPVGGHLPASMARGARIVREVDQDAMIMMNDVEIDDTTRLWKLYRSLRG